MTLKTEHSLTCNICQKTKPGSELGSWVEVVESKTDWSSGYDAQRGYSHYRQVWHVCSLGCYEIWGSRRPWPADAPAGGAAEGES